MCSGLHCRNWLAPILLAGFPLVLPTPAQDEPSIRVEVDLINVLCTVRNKQGALVNTLKQDDFVLLEEGKPQTIRHFARETNLPLTMGLLVDTSNSQVRLIGEELHAATQFFEQVIRPKDSAFLMSFDAEVKMVMEKASSQQAIKAGLERLREEAPRPRRGGTGRPRGTLLYDAIYEASAERLHKEPGRKAIVLITDGADVNSKLKIDDAIDAAQKADIMIYSIYYVDDKAYGASDWQGRPGRAVLREMSAQTGGRFFHADRQFPLRKVFDQIQQEMRSQYALDFVSSNEAKDGMYRRLEVLLREPGLTAQARKGYYTAKGGESR
jgi:VWFA-related protein